MLRVILEDRDPSDREERMGLTFAVSTTGSSEEVLCICG